MPLKRDFFVFREFFVINGNDPSFIVPDYIAHNYLTPILNPIEYNAYFEDKNMLDKIIPKKFLPRTFMRRINGKWYDDNYTMIEFDKLNDLLKDLKEGSKIVVKLTRNSSSGKGVEMYEKKEGGWKNITDKKDLSETNLFNKWKNKDLIIQEGVKQSDFFNQFNETSVNTLRLVVYNSPVDGQAYLIWGGFRVGGKGSFIDNNHAGGIMFGIKSNGEINSYGTDMYGNRYTEFNDVRFDSQKFIIPDYEELVGFAKKMAELLLPNRFIAFDIAVDLYNRPVVIEYNLRGYGGWACQFAGDCMLGDKYDEILSYLSKHRKDVKKVFYEIN